MTDRKRGQHHHCGRVFGQPWGARPIGGEPIPPARCLSQINTVAQWHLLRYHAPVGKLTDAIAQAITDSDETPAEIARGSGIAKSQLSRLLSGERGLSADAIERLAEYLGLEIVIRPRRTRREQS